MLHYRFMTMIIVPASLVGILALAAVSNAQQAPAAKADVTKEAAIEPAARNVVAAARSAGIASGADNPQVQPGLVHWHPSFADACAKAKKSGKPVLLFQMMGRLDQQFC
jgi:hypothetical protein